jgi:hypothetical protein
LTFRRRIAPLTMAIILTITRGGALAQSAFPESLPGQAGKPPVNGNSLDAVVGVPEAEVSEECSKKFIPVQEQVERRERLIKAARDRQASPDEVCKLIGGFAQAEFKVIKDVERRLAKCAIPPQQISDQLWAGHNITQSPQIKVCKLARQLRERGPSGPTGDFWPASALPPRLR